MQKNPTCPSCSHSFGTKDPAHPHGPRLPLLLRCGHTFCESCLQKLAKFHKTGVTCSSCKVITELKEEGSIKCLNPNVYILGLLSAQRRKSVATDTRVLNFTPAGMLPRKRKDNTDEIPDLETKILCKECNFNPATCCCLKCDVTMCGICFDRVHSTSNTLRKHQAVPIYESGLSLGGSVCKEHDNRAIEYYCEDDETAICSHCVIVGDHKNHAISSMEDKNKAVFADMEPVMNAASKVLKYLKKSEKVLNDSIPDNRMTAIQLIEKVQNNFQMLHGLLQAREIELAAEIEEACAEQSIPMEEMKLKIVEESKRIEFLLKDAKKVMKNNNQMILNAKEILTKLQSIESLPCHCVPVSEEKSSGVELDLKEDLRSMILDYGKVKTTAVNGFELVPLNEIVDKSDDRVSEISDDVIVEEEIEETLSTDGSQLTVSQHSQQSTGTSNSASVTDSIAHRKKITQRTKVNYVRQELVYVTHIKNPTHFIVQRVADVERLKSLARAMNKWCNGDKAQKPSTTSKDDLVLCQYALDNCWYRARVNDIVWDDDSHSSKPKLEVYYIDYGNTEVVPLEKVREMQSRFLRVPELAVQCALVDLVPADKTNPQWSLEAIHSFARMTEDKPMLMSVVKHVNGVMYVDLSKPPNDGIQDDRPISMRDSLVFLELACLETAESVHVTSGPMLLPARKFLQPELPDKDEMLDVLISHVDSPSSFYVQQINEEARYLTQMMEELQTVYANTEDLYAILCPQKDMVCVAKYQDDLWYRAQVIHLPGRRMVEIQYIDFGNKEIISHYKLRKILDRHLVLPAQGLHCCLADIEPVNRGSGWTPQVLDEFRLNAFQQRLIKIKGFTDHGLSVAMYVITDSGEICLNAYLVHEGHAVSTGPDSQLSTISMPSLVSYGVSVVSALEDQQFLAVDKQTNHVGSTTSVNLVDSGICLESQVAAQSCGSQGDNTCKPVVAQIAQEEPRQEEISIEDPGILGGWTQPQYIVQADPSKMTSSRPTDQKKPAQSEQAAESHNKSKKTFHSTVAEEERDSDWFGSISKEKVVKPSKPSAPNKEQSVKTKRSKKSKDMRGTPIIVSHVESPTVMYVRTVDEEPNLNKLMKELEGQFSKMSPVPLSLEPEDVCAAQSAGDGRWYRAKVISLLPDDYFQVHMLDFGFEEKLKMEMLRPLESQFLEYNLFAICCHLTDICAAGDKTKWSKTACEHFKELVADAECNIEPKGDMVEGSLPIDLIMVENLEGDALTPATVEYKSFNKILLEEGLAIPVRPRSQPTTPQKNLDNENQTLSGLSSQTKVPSPKFSSTVQQNALPTKALSSDSSEANVTHYPSSGIGPGLSEEPTLGGGELPETDVPTSSLLLKKRKKKREELAQPPVQFPPFELPDYPSILTVIPTYVGINGVIYAQEYKSEETPEGRLGYLLQESTLEVKVQDKYLQSIGKKRYKIIGDGNCLFRAFAQGIYGNQDQHLIVRSAVIQALQEQWDVFKDIIYEEDKMKYIQNLARPGSYGGEVEIQVVSYIFDIQTVLYMNGLHTPVLTRTYGAGSENVVELIFLSDGRHDNGHYDIAIPSSLAVPNPDYEVWRQMRIHEMQQDADKQDVTSFDDSTLAQLMDVLQNYYQDSQPEPNAHWSVGQVCAARFSQDMHWYRGRVLEISDQGVLVHYIDFGNNEYVVPDNLRSNVILTQIPQQCMECFLSGIKPNTADGHWTKEMTEFIHDTIVGESCMVELQVKPQEGEPLAVSLVMNDGRDLISMLLFVNMAIRFEEEYDPHRSEDGQLQADVGAQREGMGPYMPLELPPVNELFTAVVTQVDALDQMYIQKSRVEETEDPKVHLANQQLEALFNITMEMNSSAETYPPLETLTEGMACVAQFTADDCWYRGLLIKVEDNETAAVLYVDYGNKEIMPKERLRQIPVEFLSLPAQAACVKIAGLVPHSLNAATVEDVQMMSDTLGDSVKVAIVKAIDTPVSIELYTHIPCPGQPKPYAYQPMIDQGVIDIKSEESDKLNFGIEATPTTLCVSLGETPPKSNGIKPLSSLSWYDQTVLGEETQ